MYIFFEDKIINTTQCITENKGLFEVDGIPYMITEFKTFDDTLFRASVHGQKNSLHHIQFFNKTTGTFEDYKFDQINFCDNERVNLLNEAILIQEELEMELFMNFSGKSANELFDEARKDPDKYKNAIGFDKVCMLTDRLLYIAEKTGIGNEILNKRIENNCILLYEAEFTDEPENDTCVLQGDDISYAKCSIYMEDQNTYITMMVFGDYPPIYEVCDRYQAAKRLVWMSHVFNDQKILKFLIDNKEHFGYYKKTDGVYESISKNELQ